MAEKQKACCVCGDSKEVGENHLFTCKGHGCDVIVHRGKSRTYVCVCVWASHVVYLMWDVNSMYLSCASGLFKL